MGNQGCHSVKLSRWLPAIMLPNRLKELQWRTRDPIEFELHPAPGASGVLQLPTELLEWALACRGDTKMLGMVVQAHGALSAIVRMPRFLQRLAGVLGVGVRSSITWSLPLLDIHLTNRDIMRHQHPAGVSNNQPAHV